MPEKIEDAFFIDKTKRRAFMAPVILDSINSFDTILEEKTGAMDVLVPYEEQVGPPPGSELIDQLICFVDNDELVFEESHGKTLDLDIPQYLLN